MYSEVNVNVCVCWCCGVHMFTGLCSLEEILGGFVLLWSSYSVLGCFYFFFFFAMKLLTFSDWFSLSLQLNVVDSSSPFRQFKIRRKLFT